MSAVTALRRCAVVAVGLTTVSVPRQDFRCGAASRRRSPRRAVVRPDAFSADARRVQLPHEVGDPANGRPRVVAVGQRRPARGHAELEAVQAGGQGGRPLLQRDDELRRAELVHQRGLLLHQQDAADINDADAVGHLLGFLDVVRGQEDSHARLAQAADHVPHIAPQFHVYVRGRLVQEQDAQLVGERLGNHHPALDVAGQGDDLGVPLVPQREIAQHPLDHRRVARFAEQPTAEPTVASTVSNESVDSSCGTRPIFGLGRAVVGHHVMPVGEHGAVAGRHDAANDADQRSPGGAVRAQSRENLAGLDVEVGALQRLESRGVRLRDALDGNGRLHTDAK